LVEPPLDWSDEVLLDCAYARPTAVTNEAVTTEAMTDFFEGMVGLL
jgi:hypothetical protein